MESTLSPVLANIIGIVATAGGLTLLWLLIKASTWVSEKINSVRESWQSNSSDAAFNTFLNTKEVVASMIQDIVDALNETFKKELIEKSESGKLTKEDGKRLLEKAIELVESEISDNQKNILESGIGDLEEWIRTKIENSVKSAKDNSTKPEITSVSTNDDLEF